MSGQRTILVVEDQEDNRTILRDLSISRFNGWRREERRHPRGRSDRPDCLDDIIALVDAMRHATDQGLPELGQSNRTVTSTLVVIRRRPGPRCDGTSPSPSQRQLPATVRSYLPAGEALDRVRHPPDLIVDDTPKRGSGRRDSRARVYFFAEPPPTRGGAAARARSCRTILLDVEPNSRDEVCRQLRRIPQIPSSDHHGHRKDSASRYRAGSCGGAEYLPSP